jgi:hypothetical protein
MILYHKYTVKLKWFMPGKLLTWRGDGLGFFGLGRLFFLDGLKAIKSRRQRLHVKRQTGIKRNVKSTEKVLTMH